MQRRRDLKSQWKRMTSALLIFVEKMHLRFALQGEDCGQPSANDDTVVAAHLQVVVVPEELPDVRGGDVAEARPVQLLHGHGHLEVAAGAHGPVPARGLQQGAQQGHLGHLGKGNLSKGLLGESGIVVADYSTLKTYFVKILLELEKKVYVFWSSFSWIYTKLSHEVLSFAHLNLHAKPPAGTLSGAAGRAQRRGRRGRRRGGPCRRIIAVVCRRRRGRRRQRGGGRRRGGDRGGWRGGRRRRGGGGCRRGGVGRRGRGRRGRRRRRRLGRPGRALHRHGERCL
jgi:hypothetical protein